MTIWQSAFVQWLMLDAQIKTVAFLARAARPDICEAHDNVGWSVAMACIDVVCTLFQGLEGDLSSGGS